MNTLNASSCLMQKIKLLICLIRNICNGHKVWCLETFRGELDIFCVWREERSSAPCDQIPPPPPCCPGNFAWKGRGGGAGAKSMNRWKFVSKSCSGSSLLSVLWRPDRFGFFLGGGTCYQICFIKLIGAVLIDNFLINDLFSFCHSHCV